jgi:uncharacterized membrane protein
MAAANANVEVERGEIIIRTASIDRIVSASTAIFSARWQPLVLSGLIYFGFAIVSGMIAFGVGMAVELNAPDVGPFIQAGFAFLSNIVTWYLTLGLMKVGLMVARGQETSPANIFISANAYFRLILPILVLCGISAIPNLIPLMMEAFQDEFTGAMATLIGFSVVGLLTGLAIWTIWPMFYLAVDNRAENGSAISLGFQIGTQNLLNGFLMGLISIALGIASAVTCGLGSIVTSPLMMLIGAVAYLLMTSQPVSDPNTMPYQPPNYSG